MTIPRHRRLSTKVAQNSERNSETEKPLPPNQDILREHQFKPGQTGNAGGRPKTKPITDGLRRLLDAEYTGKEKRFRGWSNCRVLATRLFEMAIAGDISAARELADRLEGTSQQAVTLGGPDG